MKLTIDNSILAEDFFSDTKVLGIVAPVKDYRFCWLLNQALGCDFRLNSDIEIQLTKKGRQYFFSVYEYCETGTSLVHYIYNNQFEGEYLLPEFRHLDFLWLLKGDDVEDNYIHYLRQSIKSIPGIQLITELEREKIKNKMHLVF
ncbi:IPExxxVDY family protein [Agriterribacter sp.]|uniref:IPExxxVDY family protein n=1 Tax=Agriterribacter sp. TaxID=2821509 RepID=UPI002D128C4D|nr:IPExxxVDY family protein [Agriterribacter sp.]HRO46550.1 IPExxxVDY family protein [Agriterribacter sp.]HRQ19011.1 IPExxxVDY family protein [Agriterribacter sp.]